MLRAAEVLCAGAEECAGWVGNVRELKEPVTQAEEGRLMGTKGEGDKLFRADHRRW